MPDMNSDDKGFDEKEYQRKSQENNNTLVTCESS